MTDRLISLAVSIILGFLVWLYARSRDQEMLDNLPIPVTITLAAHQADQYDLEVNGPSQITASFSGPPSRIRELRAQLQRGELRIEKTLAVPESHQAESRFQDSVRIDLADLHAPPGVRTIVSEERNRIPVTLRRIVERPLQVRLEYNPEEPVAEIAVEPRTVLVRGPQEILDRIRSLPTRPYIPASRPENTPLKEHLSTGTVRLVDELEGRPIHAHPDSVTVRLTLRPQQRLYEIDVPVHFLCPVQFPLRVSWEDERASKITLRVLGPAGEEQPALAAYIDLTGRPGQKFTEGLYVDEVIQLQLPRHFQLAQPPPRSGKFRLSMLTGGAPLLGGPRPP
jgi:hypothetical protein